MLRTLLIVLAALPTSAALAQSRPSTLDWSCAEAAAIVAQRGTLVANTGPHTFGLFVANGSYCRPTEMTDPITAPTADNPYCRIGYRCVQKRTHFDD